jgi:hypothetical protein
MELGRRLRCSNAFNPAARASQQFTAALANLVSTSIHLTGSW